jgi:two-component system response regulator PhoP
MRSAASRCNRARAADRKRLLLIEDDTALRQGLKRQLQADGYRVDEAADGEEGLFLAREYPFDLAIVDLGLPKLNGLTIVQRLRGEGRATPILILTARSTWQDKVVGLEAGADDYLVKPFEYPELAARVKALLRRSLKATTDVLTLGPVSIDLSTQAVRLQGQPLELTAYEYRLLEYLVRERARVVTKQELSDYLYPHGDDRDSNVLEVLIGRLRRKLDPQGTLAPIETLRGRGYRFTLE